MRWGAKDAQQNSLKMSGRGIAKLAKNLHKSISKTIDDLIDAGMNSRHVNP
jgi:phage regulator Rha-like protein